MLFAVIGHPVGHSVSPAMHNDAFEALRMSHHYHAFDVEPKNLKKAVEGLKALGFAGFNVTVPYKIEIMPFLDEIDELALRIGAVNTVVNKNGTLIGTNTDGLGYLGSLQEVVGESLPKKNILVIGAGGAARGVAVTLDQFGVRSLDVANRTKGKAVSFIEHDIHKAASRALSLAEASIDLGKYDIIINTTPIGMSPNIDELPISLDQMKPGTILSDLIYNPLETKWLSLGKDRGAVIMNGIGMFIGQGALAFERWTGKQPDRSRMRRIVLEQLGG